MKTMDKVKKALKSLIDEYKQVKWPTLKQAINITIFVIVVSAIITLLIIGLDNTFYTLISKFID